jgi:hypothetical protein
VWPLLAFPLNAAASALLFVYRLPLLGRLLAQGVRLLQEAVSHLLNLGDVGLRLLGVRLTKRLRLHIIVLREKRTPVAPAPVLHGQIETARQAFAAAGVVLRIDVHLDGREAPAKVLDVGCNVRAYLEDLFAPGCYFEAAAHRHAFTSAFLRLIGLGSPLFAFVVQSMSGGCIGCSLGAAADYVTLDARSVNADSGASLHDPALLAHEVGHALGLLHRRDWNNLLCPFSGRALALTPWQVTVLRGSRHVTFW